MQKLTDLLAKSSLILTVKVETLRLVKMLKSQQFVERSSRLPVDSTQTQKLPTIRTVVFFSTCSAISFRVPPCSTLSTGPSPDYPSSLSVRSCLLFTVYLSIENRSDKIFELIACLSGDILDYAFRMGSA